MLNSFLTLIEFCGRRFLKFTAAWPNYFLQNRASHVATTLFMDQLKSTYHAENNLLKSLARQLDY